MGSSFGRYRVCGEEMSRADSILEMTALSSGSDVVIRDLAYKTGLGSSVWAWEISRARFFSSDYIR